MSVRLKPIKPKKISDQVFDQLREFIVRGQLKSGEKILPERELAGAMNVSRTTVRNAISRLVFMGLLEHKQGQGTFVRPPESREANPLALAMEAQNATLEDLLEVRMGLECNAAAMAAERADEADIRFLEQSLREMRTEVTSGRLGTEADVSFHMAISYATKNPVQVHIMRSFYDFLFFGIKENLYYLYEEASRIQQIIDQHKALFETIRNRDPDAARQAMQTHIHFVLNFFRNREKEESEDWG
jgi:GntR family transcriptional regulator, transcriptional repressor for pyruvate dehydrogenase complex